MDDELPFVIGAARQDWQVVLCATRDRTVPTLLAGPSSLLHNLRIDGLGLYTLVALRGPGRRGKSAVQDSDGDTIGTYAGRSLAGPFRDPDSSEATEAGSRAAYSGKQHLLWAWKSKGWYLMDGKDAGPPFMHYMNDSRTPRGVGNNIQFTPGCTAQATKRVPAADLLSATSILDLAQSELLAGYGAWYWKVHDELGSQRTPFVLEDSPARGAQAGTASRRRARSELRS